MHAEAYIHPTPEESRIAAWEARPIGVPLLLVQHAQESKFLNLSPPVWDRSWRKYSYISFGSSRVSQGITMAVDSPACLIAYLTYMVREPHKEGLVGLFKHHEPHMIRSQNAHCSGCLPHPMKNGISLYLAHLTLDLKRDLA